MSRTSRLAGQKLGRLQSLSLVVATRGSFDCCVFHDSNAHKKMLTGTNLEGKRLKRN